MNTLYFNPKCSKCQIGKAYLEERGRDFVLREYLEELPSRAELEGLFETYSGDGVDLVRPKECKELLGMDPRGKSDWELIEMILKSPGILQRPLLVSEESVIIGRPAENFG